MKAKIGFCVAIFCGWLSAATCLAQCSTGACGTATCGTAACGICGQEYRLEYHTVYDEVQHTAYRIEQETVLRPQVITSYRPVYETADARAPLHSEPARARDLRNGKSTTPSSGRSVETEMRDASYDRVRNVSEIVEQEQQYQVARPVVETQERENRYTVRRPIIETARARRKPDGLRAGRELHDALRRSGMRGGDAGLRAGRPRYRLRWESAGYGSRSGHGLPVYHRAGFYWVQIPGPSRAGGRASWQPNIVAQQVATTSYVPKVVTRKVPIQVCRYVDQEVVQKVPVQVCRMVTESKFAGCRLRFAGRSSSTSIKKCRCRCAGW